MYRPVLCALSSLVLMSLAGGSDTVTGAAMLYARGEAWVNDGAVPTSIAVFPGDKVKTSRGTTAFVTASGSMVVIVANSSFRYEMNAISLDRGGISVATSTGTEARIGEVGVKPLSGGHTVYQVSAGTDSVGIAAEEGQVKVTDPSGSTTLSPGQHKTVVRSRRHGGAPSAGKSAAIDSLPVVVTGAVAVTILGAWVLAQDAKPTSPEKP